MNTYFIKKGSKIIAPAKCHVNIADAILHDQRPANYPCKQFTERCVGISIGAAGNWNTTGKFAITKGSKCASNSCYDKEYDHSRPAIEYSTSQTTETAGTKYGCNTKESKITNSEHSFQGAATMRIITSFGNNGFNFFCPEQGVSHQQLFSDKNREK